MRSVYPKDTAVSARTFTRCLSIQAGLQCIGAELVGAR